MTAQDLIVSAMRKIGVIASGEPAKPEELADALVILNDLIDSWANQRLMIFTVNRQVFAITAAKQAWTIGPGGDFNVPRPPRIDRAGLILLSNPAQPLELPLDLISDRAWAGVPVKNIPSTVPYEVWDDGGFPLRTLTYYPAPSASAQTALYTWTALSQFPDLNVTDITFPPGYARMIRYNLAVELAPEFNAEIPAAVASIAASSKAEIKSFNVTPIEISCDEALVSMGTGGRYNIFSDSFKRS